jgi:hypothetical protein
MLSQPASPKMMVDEAALTGITKPKAMTEKTAIKIVLIRVFLMVSFSFLVC